MSSPIEPGIRVLPDVFGSRILYDAIMNSTSRPADLLRRLRYVEHGLQCGRGSRCREDLPKAFKCNQQSPTVRILLAAAITLTALAGCTDSTPAPNPCALGICALKDLPDEVDLQPDTQALMGLKGTIHGFTATPTGWAWTRSIDDGLWLEHFDANQGQLERVPLPGPAIKNAVRWAGQHLIATSAEPATLHQWIPGDSIASIELAGIDGAVRVTAQEGNQFVLQSAGLLPKFWIYDAGTLASTPLWDSNGTIIGVALSGVAHYAAVLGDESRILMHQWPHGEAFEIWQGNEPVLGIWANGPNIAFATRDQDVDRLWSVDAFTHEVESMNLAGQDPVWTANAMHFRGTGEGIDLLQTQTAAGTTHGFNLETGLWSANENGAWWLDIPRVDHRFVEAANPTDFDYLLVAPA